FAACGNAGKPADAQTSDPEASAPAENEPDARVITDILGRQVELPQEIHTIAAINGAARMLTYAGAADMLVGVTDMDKTPAAGMPYSIVNADAFKDLASVGSGGSGDTVYTEELVALSPDVIFAFTNDVDSVDNVQAKTGIPVVGIYADGIFSQSLYDTLTLIGEVTGTQTRCIQVIDAMKGWADDLNSRTEDIAEGDKPDVYAGAISFRGGHGIDGTYGEYPPFVAVNAKNVVDETGISGAMLIDLEELAVWDPDIIFIDPNNLALVNENYAVNAAFYNSLSAVKAGQVYTQVAFNYNWCNMELAMVDAYYAGIIIYPDRFSDVDFEKKAEEIFNIMLGRDYLPVLEEAGIGFGQLTIG
ncbi:MAG TPA: iron ABC transporter substrate-binding protein, partial [Clostridiales bacterium]|nr:iron ABC transporter substrate-binding protein [Clostridiales bacterium]